MPIEIVQSNSGGFNATGTQNVTLPAGTLAGSTVIIRVFMYGGQIIATPSGFTKDSPTVGVNQKSYCFRKSNVGAGESSWVMTENVAGPVAWWVDELAGLDIDASPLDASSPRTDATAATASTGTTGATTAYDAIALALHGARDSASGVGPTWTGHTNGFTEQGESAQAIAAGTSAVGMSVSYKLVSALGTYESTATHSLSPATAPVSGWVAVYAAQGSKRDPNIVAMSGAEQGTAAGVATGNLGNAPFDLVTGSPAVASGDPLATGTYCWELSAAAAAENLQWIQTGVFGGVSKPIIVARVSFWFPGSLPGGDLELFRLDPGSGAEVSVWFRSATAKIGVRAAGGTEQASAATVTSGVRYGLDLRGAATTALYTADWQLDGVDQTQATASGTFPSAFTTFSLGWTAASTGTVRYDDIAIGFLAGNYPLGDLRIYPLKVDLAGTVTISGTAGNFQTFTNNGTLAAWNATTARNAIADIPPTIGGTADGIAQITAAAADYVEMPLETYNAAGNGQALRSARVYLPGWSPSATAQALRVDGWDGTTATTLHALADPNFDNSTTAPAWIVKMWKPTTGWTQAKLDAAAVRAGFSNVAQDVGWHALLVELAVRQLPTGTLFGDLATVKADPDSAGIKTVVVTPPAGYDTTLHYEDPTATDVPVTGGTTHTEVIDAPDAPTVQYIAAYPAAEPDPPA